MGVSRQQTQKHIRFENSKSERLLRQHKKGMTNKVAASARCFFYVVQVLFIDYNVYKYMSALRICKPSHVQERERLTRDVIERLKRLDYTDASLRLHRGHIKHDGLFFLILTCMHLHHNLKKKRNSLSICKYHVKDYIQSHVLYIDAQILISFLIYD